MPSSYHLDARNQEFSALTQYMRRVRLTPRMTAEQEAACFARLARGKEEQQKAFPDASIFADAREARDQLVWGYQGLVICIAKAYRYRCRSFEFLDLIQEGTIGLLAALDHYAPTPERPYRVIASLCIHRQIRRALDWQDRMVRVPAHVRHDIGLVLAAKRQLEDYLQAEATAAQLAHQVQMPAEHVQEMLDLVARREVSLDALLTDDTSEEEETCRCPWQTPEPAYTPGTSRRDALIRHIMEQRLSERQRQVLELRFGFDRGGRERIQEEVGELLGIGQGAVCALERRASEQVRDALAWAVSGEVEQGEAQVVEAWYSRREAAQKLGCSTSSLQRKVAAGEVPVMQVACQRGWVYPKAAIDRLAAERDAVAA